MKGIPNQKLLVLGLGYVGKFQKLPTLDFHQSKPRFALSAIGNSQMFFLKNGDEPHGIESVKKLTQQKQIQGKTLRITFSRIHWDWYNLPTN